MGLRAWGDGNVLAGPSQGQDQALFNFINFSYIMSSLIGNTVNGEGDAYQNLSKCL